MQEAMLAEEQSRSLHSSDRRDLSMELEGLCACMDMVQASGAILWD
jgi:hypothetical protein